MPPEPWDDDMAFDERDDEAEAELNCGLMPDGQCQLAGSEYCDFDCPYSD